MRQKLFFSLMISLITTVTISSFTAKADNEASFIKIGPQIYNAVTLASKTGSDKRGTPYLYVILQGMPAAFSVVNLNTGKTVRTYQLANSTSAWAIDIDPKGKVWIGGTTQGNIYSFDPNTFQFRDYGNQLDGSSESSIQEILALETKVFGATANGGAFFSFSKRKEKRDTPVMRLMYDKQFARGLAYDEKNNTLYIGLGTKADLLAWNLSTGKKESILPAKYKTEAFVTKMRITGGLLFAKIEPANKFLVFDIKRKKVIDEFDATARYVSAMNDKKEVYYTNKGVFYKYNLITKQKIKTKMVLPDKVLRQGNDSLSLDWVRVKNMNRNELVLAGLYDNQGGYFIADTSKNKLYLKTAVLPKQPIELYTMMQNEQGDQIYINGFLSGGLALYDPQTNQSRQLSGIGQIESMLFKGNMVYLGGYPKARVYEYNTEQEWKGAPINPKQLFDLSVYGQERVTALASLDDTLYIGTYPEKSDKGGLLVKYNTLTNQSDIYENYINDQSIVSLVKSGEYIYGGTSIFANFKTAKEDAKFFRFKSGEENQKELIPLPFKAHIIATLLNQNDTVIWGMADGTVFSYNTATNEFKTKQIVPAISGRFKNGKILFGLDGFLYGTVEGKLFKLNPETWELFILKEDNAKDLAQDRWGNLYFRYLSDMWMYPIAKTNP
ncbi:hypothetical protein [Anoxybacteroides tepidamans]|uniref:hypothetical protein n=1 Tax=Anoxybacteroides tepidamans TaxID=265948 RepID=UPI0006872F5C|nr:hypothetical protein [Anoxybacillus tepidamans]